jgi:serine/threonine protein kinase
MGTVFEATDSRLGRKVALKRACDGASVSLQQRLVAEARALAKLSHPNVVQVYEVFEVDHLVYVALEFIDGCTLAHWQAQPRRSRRSTLEHYLQAGRGLAAAHARALVHGDFKPANVLIGNDGRVRVVDFGLAKAGHESPDRANAARSRLRRLWDRLLDLTCASRCALENARKK